MTTHRQPKLRRSALVTFAVVAIGLGGSASIAFFGATSEADVIGTVAADPATGAATSTLQLVTSKACTNANATNIIATITGSGFPAAGQIAVANTPLDAVSTNASGGYILPLASTLRDLGNQQTPPVVFSGTYNFTVTCRTNVSSASLGDFTGAINFTSATNYTSTPASPSPTPSTSTSPSSSASPTPSASASGSPSPSASASASASASPTPSGSPNPGAGITFNPASGADTSTISLTTSGPCMNSNATNMVVKVTGSGFPATGQIVVGNTPISAFTTTSSNGYEIPLAETMHDFANLQTPPATLSGPYTFAASCLPNVGFTSLGDFTGTITFTSPTAYVSSASTPSPSASPSSSKSASASATPDPTHSSGSSGTQGSSLTVAATDASGNPLGENPTLTPGQDLNVTVTGYKAGDDVSVTLHSTPRDLGTTFADKYGAVHYTFKVPTNLPSGQHSLVFQGSKLTAAFAFTIGAQVLGTKTTTSGSSLAYTGASIVPQLMLGITMLVVGTALLVHRRDSRLRGRGRHRAAGTSR